MIRVCALGRVQGSPWSLIDWEMESLHTSTTEDTSLFQSVEQRGPLITINSTILNLFAAWNIYDASQLSKGCSAFLAPFVGSTSYHGTV